MMAGEGMDVSKTRYSKADVVKAAAQNIELWQLVKKHIKSCEQWNEGMAKMVYTRDGMPCVKYESGAWWHYDITAGTWW